MDFSLLNAVATLENPDGVIALPGPDGYVLAARLSHSKALTRLGRLAGNLEPILILGCNQEVCTAYAATVPDSALRLMRRHWPGPLIIQLLKGEKLLEPAGQSPQVALAIPTLPLWMALLTMIPEGALATRLACRPGDPWVRTSIEVLNHFGDDVDLVVADDESLCHAVAPTVVSVDTKGAVHLLRSGRIVLD